MENTIKVLKVEVGKSPYEKVIGNDLKSLQAEVCGLIEVLPLGDDCLLICNEEGKVKDMQPNRGVGDDIICGPFFICADTEDGDFASLTDEQMKRYGEMFSDIPIFQDDGPQLETGVIFIRF